MAGRKSQVHPSGRRGAARPEPTGGSTARPTWQTESRNETGATLSLLLFPPAPSRGVAA